MKTVALALLLFFAAVYVVSTYFAPTLPWLEYVAAFSEAAMIGALADWFAVVALFRHPMGIPIWHTAVIPNRKEDLARGLGSFAEQHFVTPDAIAARVQSIDPATRLGAWLRQPQGANEVATALGSACRTLLDGVDDATVGPAVGGAARSALRDLDLSSASGSVVARLQAERLHQQLFDGVLGGVSNYLGNPEHAPQVKGFVLQAFSVDNPMIGMVLDSMMPRITQSLVGTLDEVRANPDHPWRAQVDAWVAEFAVKLLADERWQSRVREIQDEMLAQPLVEEWLAGLWPMLKQRLQAYLSGSPEAVNAQFNAVLQAFGRRLEGDQALRDTVNARIGAIARELVVHSRGEIGAFIQAQVDGWSKDDISARVESAVGRDLQFIRINGTLVGGLVGLTLFCVTRWLGF